MKTLSFIFCAFVLFTSNASASCADPDKDMLGDYLPERQWQRAGTPMRCGPWQPWNISLKCPSEYPAGMSCRGHAHGTLCYGRSSGRIPGYRCDAPNGQWPDQRANAEFDIYVCP
jgi:hypothetical protein